MLCKALPFRHQKCLSFPPWMGHRQMEQVSSILFKNKSTECELDWLGNSIVWLQVILCISRSFLRNCKPQCNMYAAWYASSRRGVLQLQYMISTSSRNLLQILYLRQLNYRCSTRDSWAQYTQLLFFMYCIPHTAVISTGVVCSRQVLGIFRNSKSVYGYILEDLLEMSYRNHTIWISSHSS